MKTMTGKRSPRREEAEAIALQALVFLTEDRDRLSRFLLDTGMSPGDLGNAVGSPEALVAVLDHLLGDESLLLVFTSAAGIDPAVVQPARAILDGGRVA
ncbi:MAG: DUF3572 domain-containing protein [Hyphomicrobiaceae bacterium]